jgi:hypothetical protein
MFTVVIVQQQHLTIINLPIFVVWYGGIFPKQFQQSLYNFIQKIKNTDVKKTVFVKLV